MDDGDSCPVLVSCKKLKSVFNYLNRIPITSDNFSLGHGLKNSVTIPFMVHISISRNHCQFKKGKNNEWILEVNSRFGVKINGVTLGKGLEKKLRDGDIISLECTDEFVYKFLNSPSKKEFEVPRRRLKSRRKLNGIQEQLQTECADEFVDKLPNSPSKEVFEVPRRRLKSGRKRTALKEQLQTEMNRKIKNEFAAQIDNIEEEKNEVACQKTILLEERVPLLETIKMKYSKEQISKLMDLGSSLVQLSPLPLWVPVALSHGRDGTPLPAAKSPPPRQGADKMREREEIQKISEAQNNAEKSRAALPSLAAERIQKQPEQSVAINTLHEQLGKLKIQLQTVETERDTILEDICAPENCGEGSSKEMVLNEMGELMESELQCSICNEVFVEPTTLNCSHTFCKYCISVWKKNKKNCPICRASIKSECKSLALNSFIEKMVQNLSEEMKQKRKEILEGRKGL